MTFLEILKHYRIPYREAGTHHHVSHGWLGLDCPRCSPGTSKFRCGYNLARGYCYCWQCGYVPVLAVLAEVLGEPYDTVKKLVGGLTYNTRLPAYKGVYNPPSGVGPLLPPHRAYLEERKLDVSTVESLWGVQGIGLHPRLSWRLFIPITLRREPVSWTTRAIRDDPRRYWGADKREEAIPAKTLLYGDDWANMGVVVVEGPVDVWRIGPGAVATLGLGITKAQVRRLLQFPIRAICFDNDKQAQRRARTLCKALAAFPGETHRVQLDAKDAGSATESELNELRGQFLR